MCFSMSDFTYFGPLIVVLGGMKYRPAAPRHDKANQIIWLSRRAIVGTAYCLSKRLPNDRLMCMWRVTNWCMAHSSEKQHFLPLSESPMAITSGKFQSLFLHHWCQVWLSCRPVGLQSNCLLRRLNTVLELMFVHYKMARIVLQELFVERIAMFLIERSSLAVVFRERPDLCPVMKRAINIAFDDSIDNYNCFACRNRCCFLLNSSQCSTDCAITRPISLTGVGSRAGGNSMFVPPPPPPPHTHTFNPTFLFST